jgi:hypothetical protein
MAKTGRSSHRHIRKSPLGRFLDLLRGKSKKRPSSGAGFPGINIPEDYDPEQANKNRQEKPEFLEDENKMKVPDHLVVKSKPKKRRRKKDKKSSLRSKIDLYFRNRAIRKEEKKKNRIKRKMRRRHQKEHKKMEAGRSVREKLLSISERGEEPSKKKIPVFSQKSSLYRNLTITVNSTFVFILTYVLAYLIYWITCVLVASWYGLDSTLYFYDLKFNDHSQLWTRFNILLVTGIPPFFSLFLGFLLLRYIFKIKRLVALQKLFVLWLSFHLFNHFFGAFPSGIITDEGFGYVAAWMYMNTAFKFLFSIISLFILGVIGYFSAQKVLETSDSMNRIKPENRVSFILGQLALPWLVGTIVLLLVRLPENFTYPYETLMLFSMVFLVIPPFFNEKVKPKLNLVKIKKKRNVNIGYLAMMLVFLAFLRIMLGIGLHFIINIEISISPALS